MHWFGRCRFPLPLTLVLTRTRSNASLCIPMAPARTQSSTRLAPCCAAGDRGAAATHKSRASAAPRRPSGPRSPAAGHHSPHAPRRGRAAERVSTAAGAGLRQAADGLGRRIAGGPLSSICRGESLARPCPRVLLVSGAYLAAGGLDAPGLFREDAPAELVHYLAGAFDEGARQP